MVQYPSIKIKLPDRIVDSEKIYEWFMANKQSKDNNAKPNDPKILQPLPSDITTPYLYRFIDGKPSKSCINDLNKKRQNDKALGNKYARKLGINATGKIKFYKAEKNFGFIITDAGDDIYFNKQNIKLGSENLAPGDKVAFIIDNTNKKPEAIEVAKI